MAEPVRVQVIMPLVRHECGAWTNAFGRYCWECGGRIHTKSDAPQAQA